MSYLQKQQDAFRATVQSVAPKVQNKRALAAPVPASAPSPAPSNASTSSKPEAKSDNKRKREVAPNIVYSQPAATGYGTDHFTQVQYVLEFLKKKDEPKTFLQILQYLSIPGTGKGAHTVARILKSHTRVAYTPDPQSTDWDSGVYEFRPLINVRNRTDLIAYLQNRPDAQGVKVKELKDGWPDVEEAINALEPEHKILVSRTKKDNQAKMVWSDDPTLFHPIDAEFQTMWHKTELPSVDELVRKLQEAGQKPASEDPSKRIKVVKGNKEKKKRKPRAGGKTTNTHMQHLLKDYSHLKR